jgi:hypothetical protein
MISAYEGKPASLTVCTNIVCRCGTRLTIVVDTGSEVGPVQQQPFGGAEQQHHQQAAPNAAYSPHYQHAATRFPSLATYLTMRPARDGACRLHHLAPSSASPRLTRSDDSFRPGRRTATQTYLFQDCSLPRALTHNHSPAKPSASSIVAAPASPLSVQAAGAVLQGLQVMCEGSDPVIEHASPCSRIVSLSG